MESSRSQTQAYYPPHAPVIRPIELPSDLHYESPSPMSAGVGALGTPHSHTYGSRSLMTPPSPSSPSTSSRSSSRKAPSPSHEQLQIKRLSRKGTRARSIKEHLKPDTNIFRVEMPSTPSSHSSAASHPESYHQSPYNHQNDYYSPTEKDYYSPDFQSRRYSPQGTSPSYPSYPPYAPCTPYKPLPAHYPLTPPYESRPLP